MIMFNLNNKVAIVTGGSRGIGKAISLKLAQNGAHVAITYLGSEKKAMNVCNEIKKLNRKCKAFCCNVADFDDTKKVIDGVIREFGTIDILINNAGITGKVSLAFLLNSDDFDAVINTNLKGTFNMCRHVYPIFVKNHTGKIINIASVAGISGMAGQAIYSASKAGIIAFSQSIAKELASRGITCNAIAPGFIETDMTANVKDSTKDSIPVKKFGSPEDVANLAVFLASSDSDYITGEIIKVDGGLNI